MTNLEKAKSLLVDDVTCAMSNGTNDVVSKLSGIGPMITWLEQGFDFDGYEIADRIVGKATAMLFVYAGIKKVFAKVISKPGLEYLKSRGVDVTYEVITDNIINRQKNGLCPMEQIVLNLDNEKEAYLVLKEQRKILMAK